MSDGVLYVEVMPSTKGIGRAITGDLDKSLQGTEKKSQSMFGKFAKWGTIAVAAVGASVAAIALKGGISRALNIEDAQAKLKGLGHDTKAVEAIMADALASVKGTAFGLDTAATVAATAVAAGIKPGRDLEKYLRLTADAATIAGVSMEEMGSILNKTTTAGKVYTQELNQLADKGLPVFQWLQDEYGVTAEELRKMVSAGKVDAETFRKVIEENIGGAALASGETTRGAFKNMMAAFSRLGAAFITPILDPLKEVFGTITGGVDSLTSKLAPLGAAIGSAFSLLVTGDFTAAIREATGWEEDAPIVGGLLRLHDAFAGLRDLIVNGNFSEALRNAFGWEEDSSIVDFILNLRDSIANLDFGALIKSAFEGRANLYEAGLKLVQSLLEGIIQNIPVIVQGASDMVTRILGAIVAMAPSILTAAVELFSGLVTALIDILPDLIATLVGLLPVIVETIVAMIPVLIEAAIQLFTVLVEAIPAIIPMLLDAILNLLPVVLTALVGLIPALYQGAIDLFIAIVKALPEIIPALIQAIIGLTPVLITTIIGLIPDLLTAAIDMFTALIDALPVIIPELINAVAGMGPKIVDAVIKIGPKLLDAGKKIIGKLIDGVKSMIGAVGDAFGGIMDFIGGFFPHSPAKWGPFSGAGWAQLAKSGAAVVDEFMAGFERDLPNVQATLDTSLKVPSGVVGASTGPFSLDGMALNLVVEDGQRFRAYIDGRAGHVISTRTASTQKLRSELPRA